MEVCVVTVFESGDFTTSPWAVYEDEKDAERYKEELLAGELNQDGYNLAIDITKHEVIDKDEGIWIVTVFESGW